MGGEPKISDRLDEIERRAAAAFDGPWDLDKNRGWGTWSVVAPASDGHPDYTRCVADGLSDANAQFIAYAREDIPWLLTQLRNARAEIERLPVLERSIRSQGWSPFGTHIDCRHPLEFSDEADEGGLPVWERVPLPTPGEADR